MRSGRGCQNRRRGITVWLSTTMRQSLKAKNVICSTSSYAYALGRVGGRCRYLPWKLITILKFAPFFELTIIGSSRSNNSAQLRGRSGDRCRSTISTRVVDDNRPPYAESVDGPAREGPTACHPTPIITRRCKLHLD